LSSGQSREAEKKTHQAKGFLCFSSAAGELGNLLATRDFPIYALYFLDEIFFYACAEKNLCSKKGLYVSTGFLIGILCRQTSEKKSSFRRENMVKCPYITFSLR
jgi:hypothetical protein